MNMKKIAYLSVLAGLLLTACTEGDYGIKPADPQANQQEEFVTLPTGVAAAAVNPIDLAEVEGESVAVATFTPIELTEGESKYTIIVDDTYKYSVGADMKVPVADLQAMVEETYGKRPTARKFKAVLNIDVMVDGQASLIQSEAFDLVITPVAPFIDSAYYLVGDMCGWDKASALKFNHSSKDVYEDPVFTLVVTVPDTDANGGDYWKIIPAGNYESADDFWTEGPKGVVGVAVDGDTAAEGKLVTEKPQAGKIAVEEEGLFKITINMMDYTYKVEELNYVEYLRVPGNHQGWSPATAPRLYGNFDGIWNGFSQLNGGFKFTKGDDWSDGEYAFGSFTTMASAFSDDGGNINATTPGFYWLQVDDTTLKLDAVLTTTWGIVGPAQAGGWDADTDMAWNADKGCWAIYGVALTAGEMKFRANDDWGVNVGGSFDDLTKDGANIAVEAGTYDIELYLERTASDKMYATVTKK